MNNKENDILMFRIFPMLVRNDKNNSIVYLTSQYL